MKKAFGIIFLLLGLAMIVMGIAALTHEETRSNSYEGNIQNTISERHYEQSQNEKTAGILLTGGGFILFIIGIIMVASKSGSQRRKEAELAYYKQVQGQPNTNDNGRKADALVQQAIALYNQHEYHPAIILMQQARALNPANNSIYYNLACLFSLTHDPEAFEALSKAVEFGYTNFEKINTQRDLEWLRHHADYNDFVKHGYKLKVKHSDYTHQTAGDGYEKLERLAQLKQKRVINEEEFAREKRRILG